MAFALIASLGCVMVAMATNTKAPGAATPIYHVTEGSQIQGSPRFSISPLSHVGIGGGKGKAGGKGRQRNGLTFGVPNKLQFQLKLSAPLGQGAKLQAWFSELSLGSAARLAANQFMPLTDACHQLRGTKYQCPVKAGTSFQVYETVGESTWSEVRKYVDANTVIGSHGVLELRLWDGEPCVLCWRPPALLAGFTVPFEVLGEQQREKMGSEAKAGGKSRRGSKAAGGAADGMPRAKQKGTAKKRDRDKAKRRRKKKIYNTEL